jgi:hypothetical protein
LLDELIRVLVHTKINRYHIIHRICRDGLP